MCNQPDEPVSGVKQRKKAASTIPIGVDYSTILKVTTIDQSGSRRLQYLCKNLHACHHGSIHKSDIGNKEVIYDFVGTSHKILSTIANRARGGWKDGDVVVAFFIAVYFRNIKSQLQSRGFVEGLITLETYLAEHMLALGDTDRLRLKGKIGNNSDMVRINISVLASGEFKHHCINKIGTSVVHPCLEQT